jgi:hypothetical protein
MIVDFESDCDFQIASSFTLNVFAFQFLFVGIG